MNNKNDIFEKIDSYFEGRDKKEFYYVLVFIVLFIGFVIYYYIFPMAQDYKTEQQKINNDLRANVTELKKDIAKLNREIFDLNKAIIKLKADLGKVKKEKVFYEELAKLLDFTNFNQYVWAQFVRGCVDDAKLNGLEVLDINNVLYVQEDENVTANTPVLTRRKVKKIKKPKGFISKKVDVTLTLKGDYKNFLWYIYDYENRKELIRVNKMQIITHHKFLVTFSLYGKNR